MMASNTPNHVYKDDRWECWEVESQLKAIEQPVDMEARLVARKMLHNEKVRLMGQKVFNARTVTEKLKIMTGITAIKKAY